VILDWAAGAAEACACTQPGDFLRHQLGLGIVCIVVPRPPFSMTLLQPGQR
jgi:hypothetical protein